MKRKWGARNCDNQDIENQRKKFTNLLGSSSLIYHIVCELINQNWKNSNSIIVPKMNEQRITCNKITRTHMQGRATHMYIYLHNWPLPVWDSCHTFDKIFIYQKHALEQLCASSLWKKVKKNTRHYTFQKVSSFEEFKEDFEARNIQQHLFIYCCKCCYF